MSIEKGKVGTTAASASATGHQYADASRTAFTPGPWVVFHADEDGANDVLPAGRVGCIAQEIHNAADARLIAAAPDLFAALEEVFSAYCALPGADFDWDAWGERAQAALARATGSQP